MASLLDYWSVNKNEELLDWIKVSIQTSWFATSWWHVVVGMLFHEHASLSKWTKIRKIFKVYSICVKGIFFNYPSWKEYVYVYSTTSTKFPHGMVSTWRCSFVMFMWPSLEQPNVEQRILLLFQGGTFRCIMAMDIKFVSNEW
jgi:hypothetical protein